MTNQTAAFNAPAAYDPNPAEPEPKRYSIPCRRHLQPRVPWAAHCWNATTTG
jgi:hypothetical protein